MKIFYLKTVGLMDYSIFKFFILILILKFSLFGEIYILSYKIVVKNGIVSADSLYIANLMIPSKKFKTVETYILEAKKRDSNRFIIRKNREYILETLFKKGIILNDFTTSINFQNRNQTVMILPPLYISIDRIGLDTYFSHLQSLN